MDTVGAQLWCVMHATLTIDVTRALHIPGFQKMLCRQEIALLNVP
jgi:hypothetical protein